MALLEGFLGVLGDEIPDPGIGNMDGAKKVRWGVSLYSPEEGVQLALLKGRETQQNKHTAIWARQCRGKLHKQQVTDGKETGPLAQQCLPTPLLKEALFCSSDTQSRALRKMFKVIFFPECIQNATPATLQNMRMPLWECANISECTMGLYFIWECVYQKFPRGEGGGHGSGLSVNTDLHLWLLSQSGPSITLMVAPQMLTDHVTSW